MKLTFLANLVRKIFNFTYDSLHNGILFHLNKCSHIIVGQIGQGDIVQNQGL